MDITDNIPLHQGNIPRSEVIVLTKMPLTFDITANKSSVHKFDSAMPFVIYIAISVNELPQSICLWVIYHQTKYFLAVPVHETHCEKPVKPIPIGKRIDIIVVSKARQKYKIVVDQVFCVFRFSQQI